MAKLEGMTNERMTNQRHGTFCHSCFVILSAFEIRALSFSNSQLLRRFDESKQDGNRNGRVADKQKPREDSATQGETRREFLVI